MLSKQFKYLRLIFLPVPSLFRPSLSSFLSLQPIFYYILLCARPPFSTCAFLYLHPSFFSQMVCIVTSRYNFSKAANIYHKRLTLINSPSLFPFKNTDTSALFICFRTVSFVFLSAMTINPVSISFSTTRAPAVNFYNHLSRAFYIFFACSSLVSWRASPITLSNSFTSSYSL